MGITGVCAGESYWAGAVLMDKRLDILKYGAAAVLEPKSKLCRGTGDNRTGVCMKVNNDICPRCGGYGTVPDSTDNLKSLTDQDNEFIDCNGRVNENDS